jgi:hypothetical protein
MTPMKTASTRKFIFEENNKWKIKMNFVSRYFDKNDTNAPTACSQGSVSFVWTIPHSNLFQKHERVWFLGFYSTLFKSCTIEKKNHSVQISYHSILNFSVQVENGWDYFSRAT